ncbi:MAG: SPOR domain-containing protein, partial [Pseudomonadota bacterium]
MAVYDDRDSSHVQYIQTSSLSSYAGAAVSLALVIGVSVWGYQLVMRDVSGIPVVRAAEGAMRIAPTDAGGEIADHAGLAVNQVAGEGEAAGPVESLLLAPQSRALAEEDLRVEPLAEAEEVIPAAEA